MLWAGVRVYQQWQPNRQSHARLRVPNDLEIELCANVLLPFICVFLVRTTSLSVTSGVRSDAITNVVRRKIASSNESILLHQQQQQAILPQKPLRQHHQLQYHHQQQQQQQQHHQQQHHKQHHQYHQQQVSETYIFDVALGQL